MERSKLLIVSVALLVALLAACNRPSSQQPAAGAPEPSLVGKWQEVTANDMIEFREDGSFAGTMAYGGEAQLRDLAGKYFVAGDKISINLNDGAPMTWQFQQSGDDLVLTYVAGGYVKIDGSMAKFRHSS